MRISIIIIVLLLFSGTIVTVIPQFKYIDESLMIIFFIVAFIKTAKNKEIRLKRIEIISIFMLIVYFFIGFISNYRSRILLDVKSCILSGILSVKFIIVYILCRICFRNIKINYRWLNKLYKFLNISLVVYVTLILINIKFQFFHNFGERLSIKTTSAGFSHPSELDFLSISIMVMQFFLIIILKKNIKSYKYICLMSFIIILFAGRTKSMVFFTLYSIIVLGSKFIKNIKFKHFILISPIAIFISKDRIISEIMNLNSVRGTLYRVSFEIANKFLPFGSGFGTYGSEASKNIYSPLYYMYNMSNTYGFSTIYPNYITDAHWASVIGETGWIGFLILLTIVILLTVEIAKYSKITKVNIAISGLWMYGLISSVSDTILITYRGICMVVITTFFISIIDTVKIEENIN